jgi:hypothetical protein
MMNAASIVLIELYPRRYKDVWGKFYTSAHWEEIELWSHNGFHIGAAPQMSLLDPGKGAAQADDEPDYSCIGLVRQWGGGGNLADVVERKVAEIATKPAGRKGPTSPTTMVCIAGTRLHNVAHFLQEVLPRFPHDPEHHYVGIMHGDLHGDNALVDGHENGKLVRCSGL